MIQHASTSTFIEARSAPAFATQQKLDGLIMTADHALHSLLKDERVELWIHHGEVQYRDPHGVLTAEQIEILKNRGKKIIDRVTQLTLRDEFRFEHGPNRFPLTFQQCFALNYFGKFFSFVSPLRLRGLLDENAVARSLAQVIQRHEILRTRLVITDGTAMQEVCDPESCALTHIDLTGVPDESIDSLLQETIKNFRSCWLADSTKAFEFALITISERDHVLIVGFEHVFWDWYSIELFFHDLWLSYRLLRNGTQHASPLTQPKYSDYAIYQHKTYPEWIREHGEFWKKKTAGASCLQIPIDNDLEAAAPNVTKSVSIEFGDTLSEALCILAKRQEVTLPIAVLALYVALAAQWSGQRNFVISFVTSGRHYSEHLYTMGYFPYLLPLRICLKGDETFSELMRLVSREFFLASDNLEAGPLLDAPPDIFRSGYFQWFHRAPTEILRSGLSSEASIEPNLLVESFIDSGRSRSLPCDMELTFWKGTQAVSGQVCYRADLFSSVTMEKFAKDMSFIAGAVVQDPHSCVWQMSQGIRRPSLHAAFIE